jgi:hypothetical protein
VLPLVLVASSFDVDGPEVYLTFDRAIDISALVASAFEVDDGPDNGHFIGISAFFIDPAQVQVIMNRTGDASGPDTLLTAGAANGIVAVDDGGTWDGVTDLTLPFP